MATDVILRDGEEMMPGRNGGLLRRGGGAPRKSILARKYLEAKSLEAAKRLASIGLDGKLAGYRGKITLNERIKALEAMLARGGVPPASRQENTGADGAPIRVEVFGAPRE